MNATELLICVLGVILFFLGDIVWVLYRKKKQAKSKLIYQSQMANASSLKITSQDIRAIAGEDMITTQLDLARAYIEMGKIKLAQQILEHTIENGNAAQQQQANQLMNQL